MIHTKRLVLNEYTFFKTEKVIQIKAFKNCSKFLIDELGKKGGIKKKNMLSRF